MNNTHPSPTSVLELRNIEKHYGHVAALRGATLDIRSHEILALLGDNGAGKSTLVKVISGVIKPDTGLMRTGDRIIGHASPSEARRFGIETVYQDLALIDQLPIWRNFYLGCEVMCGPPLLKRLDVPRMRRTCMDSLERMGIVDVPSPDILVGDLSGGQRQAVAIARAVHKGARMLILDEPTAALGVHASQQVYQAMRSARDHGAAVMLISHDIGEAYEVADRLAILEHGRVVAEYTRPEASLQTILDRLLLKHVQPASAG